MFLIIGHFEKEKKHLSAILTILGIVLQSIVTKSMSEMFY